MDNAQEHIKFNSLKQKKATFKSNAGNKSNVTCTITAKTKATRKQTIQKYFQEQFKY